MRDIEERINLLIEKTASEIAEIVAGIHGIQPGDLVELVELPLIELGGAGSGHFGHKGRPGEVGGSLPSGVEGISSSVFSAYSGQINGSTYAYLGSAENYRKIGYIDWSVFQGNVFINMIEVDKEYRRRGIATALLRDLRNEFPDAEIKIFGNFATEEGQAWLNSVESIIERGGPGSGHFGHEGRPGEVGGSLPSGESVEDEAERLAEIHQAEYEATRNKWEQELLDQYGEGEWESGIWIGPSGKFLAPLEDHQQTALDLLGWDDDVMTREGMEKGAEATRIVVSGGLVRYNYYETEANFDIPNMNDTTDSQWASMAAIVTTLNQIIRKEYGENARAEVNISIGSGVGRAGYNEEIRGREAYEWLGLEDEYDYGVYRGGAGSGHFGHAGRPGEVGGSQPSELADSRELKKRWVRQIDENLTSTEVQSHEVFGDFFISPSGAIYHENDKTTQMGRAMFGNHALMARRAVMGLDLSEMFEVLNTENPRLEFEDSQAIMMEGLGYIRGWAVDDDELNIQINRQPSRKQMRTIRDIWNSREYINLQWELDYAPHEYADGRTSEFDRFETEVNVRRAVYRGGPGSGHFGHEGRPGEVGGSRPSGLSDYKPLERNTIRLIKPSGWTDDQWMDYQEKFRTNVEQALTEFAAAVGIEPSGILFTNNFRVMASKMEPELDLNGRELINLADYLRAKLDNSAYGAFAEGALWLDDNPTMLSSPDADPDDPESYIPLPLDSTKWRDSIYHELGHWVDMWSWRQDRPVIDGEAAAALRGITPSESYADLMREWYGDDPAILRREYVADLLGTHARAIREGGSWWWLRNDLSIMTEEEYQDVETALQIIEDGQARASATERSALPNMKLVLFPKAREAVEVEEDSLGNLPPDAEILDIEHANS